MVTVAPSVQETLLAQAVFYLECLDSWNLTTKKYQIQKESSSNMKGKVLMS